jgi:hypothetical protein
VERPHATVALDQRENRVHVTSARTHLGIGLPAHIGPVCLDGFALAADWWLKQVVVTLHDLSDTVSQEPRGFHAAIEGPLNLAGAH